MPTLPHFAPVPQGHILQKVAMPLVGRFHDGELFVGGTAFMIGKHLALTAVHVLDEIAQHSGQKFPTAGHAAVHKYEILGYLFDANG